MSRVFELEEVRRVRDEVVVQRVENAQVHARHAGVAGSGVGGVGALDRAGPVHRSSRGAGWWQPTLYDTAGGARPEMTFPGVDKGWIVAKPFLCASHSAQL